MTDKFIKLVLLLVCPAIIVAPSVVDDLSGLGDKINLNNTGGKVNKLTL